MMKPSLVLAILLCLVGALPLAAADGVASLEIEGSKATATIELPGGVAADLELAFDQVLGLSAESLGLSAALVDPADLTLLSRLPNPQQMGVPAGFPVLVTVEPPPTGPLSFTGTVALQLHTHNLTFTPGSPLRLLAAADGGLFTDITESVGMGSYRVRGTKGGFSEFLIIADLRPLDLVTEEKFKQLDALLEAHALDIPAPVLASLSGHLAAAWDAYMGGLVLAAGREMDAFGDEVKAASGAAGIPDTWRSARDLVNVAGELRAAAATLRFSLNLASAGI